MSLQTDVLIIQTISSVRPNRFNLKNTDDKDKESKKWAAEDFLRFKKFINLKKRKNWTLNLNFFIHFYYLIIHLFPHLSEKKPLK